MLALEIELLTGVYRAALPDNSAAEWPPHPERAFSALVQSWGDGGCDDRERAALEWLESLPAPCLKADPMRGCDQRSAPTVFVPPNDSRGNELAALPGRRSRQARNFRVAVPANSLVTLIWPAAQGQAEHRTALAALAHRVASLGHSASLVRFAFIEATEDGSPLWRPDSDGDVALRVAHPGRLRRLEDWLSKDEWPLTGMSMRYLEPQETKPPQAPNSVFGGVGDWFIFEDVGGVRPDLLAFAHVAKCVRASLMKHGPQPSPEIISGHTPGGEASSRPHLAIVPLANVGWPHATGDLLGFAVILPRTAEGSDRDRVLRALGGFAPVNEDGEAWADLHLSSNIVWRVERTVTPSRASLKPERWCRAAVSWASATPVLLDRYPDHGDPIEAGRLIAAACGNIGLPEPVEIELHKHSAVHGAPSAYPPGGIRPGSDWSFPHGAKFASRPRRHVILRFAEPVEGPIILGAGRFHGFGFCLPLTQERDL
ncbi:MAG: type I-U CRISPR-associated protein Cas5/Cas6 [Candidatus Binataceae bacterium]|nr:type I-U CRISPR-associated protein Cas5/Cas6 [Candidatus Binataceae bacterium]